VKPGEGGNVPANTIRVVPQGQDPVLLRVNNPDPTSGGTHTETPEVKKAEVDKAVATVKAQLQKAFDDAIAAGAGAPPETTLFPQTADLGVVTPDVDPQTLVGQAVPTFDIRFTAKGTVIAVDPRPVTAIAEAQLNAKVAANHQLVAGSSHVDVGEGTVGEDGQVTFEATARAIEVAIVDPDALRALVKGKTAADARAALAQFGDATVTLWPDWASLVTGVDARLSITIEGGPAGAGGAGASPSAGSASPPPSRPPASARPSASGVGGPGTSSGSAAP
jgi:hypothetical protein